MTLSRRGFLGGLAGLLSLLVWPWKKPTSPEDAQSLWWVSWDGEHANVIHAGREGEAITYGPDSDIVKLLNEPKRRPGMKYVGESPSVQALKDTDMLSNMLEAHEKLRDTQPKTYWLTIPERHVALWEKHFPGEMIQVTRKLT